jgi:uncharacterized sulfatase
MVIHGPGFTGGKEHDEMVSLIDLPPTILAAGGADVPEHFRGRPVQQIVNGSAKDWPDDVFMQISEDHCGRAVRTKRWKYSVRAFDKDGAAPGSETYVEDFLYDLQKDPHEKNNLVADPALADVRAELAQRLKRHMIRAGEKEPRIVPCEKGG